MRQLTTLALVAVMAIATGCATTADYTPQSEPQVLADIARRGQLAGQVGSQIYLDERDDMSIRDRETVRQAYIAVRRAVEATQAEGGDLRELIMNLATYASVHVENKAYFFAVQVVITEVVAQVDRQGFTADADPSVTERRLQTLVAAVVSGIELTLAANRIDPDTPVEGESI